MLLPFAALNRSVPPSRAASSLPLNRVLGIFFAGLLLSLLWSSAIAQEPTPEDVIRVRTDLVTVPAVVLDSRGNRVFGLKQEDFVMRDEGRGVRLDHFSTGTDHVALAFLLDASGSAQEYVARQHEAALALFSRFGTGSEVAVLRFGERAEVAAPFTTDLSVSLTTWILPCPSFMMTAASSIFTLPAFSSSRMFW